MDAFRLLERAAGPLAGLSAATFAGLSAARGKRFFHPTGEVLGGQITFQETSLGLPFDGIHPVIARLSRGIGLPQSAPDVLGLAVKIPDDNQDLLFATSGESAVTRHLLLPAGGFFSMPYSTILPYELHGRLIVFGAKADDDLREMSRAELADLGPLVATGRLRFELTVGGAGTSEHQTFASLVLDESHGDSVSFNPWNTHPDLHPAGGLNRLRRDSYRSSQAARPDGDVDAEAVS
ncbi:MAG: hypothetical protein M3280_09095 [Actinomycetota bacterium]|nr:hypothetical protein [Actinomycetota bacterium]